MRLNGWQRLWVVGAVLWTLAVSLGAWRTWPIVGKETVSVFPNAYGGPPIGYYEALAFAMGGSRVGGATDPLVVDANEGQLVEIPNVGTVSFPKSMPTPEMEARAKTLDDEHRKLLQRINQERREDFSAQRRGAIQFAIAALLLPPLAIYALGWALVWVYRGFRAS